MLIYENNQFWNGPEVEFTTLEEAQANRSTVVDIVAMSLRNQATINTSPAEMASWPLKLQEAQAGGGPMLKLEAQYRNIPESELVHMVLALAYQLSVLEATIAGVAGKHNDAIYKLTTIEEVRAYDMQAGWPGM